MNWILLKGVEVLTPRTVNVILFGKEVSADGHIKIRSLRWALIQYDYILIKWENLDTEVDVHGGERT